MRVGFAHPWVIRIMLYRHVDIHSFLADISTCAVIYKNLVMFTKTGEGQDTFSGTPSCHSKLSFVADRRPPPPPPLEEDPFTLLSVDAQAYFCVVT